MEGTGEVTGSMNCLFDKHRTYCKTAPVNFNSAVYTLTNTDVIWIEQDIYCLFQRENDPE